jgi:glycerol-3-phosphate dehydrogenase
MPKPHAIIIGAGFTGCATAHDLGLRGFDVTVIDRGDIANGTSGRTHGLLHSGARYCVKDRESAVECIVENNILRKITPQCIEPNGGIFIAISESDLEYRQRFIEGAEQCHIDIKELSPQDALQLEPNLNPKLLAAVWVPDGTFEPLRLALSFAATAKSNGAHFYLYTEVEGMTVDGKGNVTGVKVWDRKSGERKTICADIVVNATGAWAGEITMMAGLYVPVKPTPGVMVAFDQRLTDRPINRLCEPDDGDIVLPQRRMVVVGTTSFEVEYVDYVPVLEEQIQTMVSRGAELVPAIRNTHMRGAFMSSRPLVGSGTEARSIARTFKCFDHRESDNIDGLVTITGGKATTCRAMAEKTADIVCSKMGIQAGCLTATIPLRSYRDFYQIQ